MIALILQLRDEHVVSDYPNIIIKSFENDVLPLFFYINSVIREDLIQNLTTKMAKKLFNLNENLFLIYMAPMLVKKHQQRISEEILL